MLTIASLLPFLSHMDSLNESLASRFSLVDGESDLVAANPSMAAKPSGHHDLSLVGRVITDKKLSINFIRPNALRLLHPVKGATINSIATNMFVIKFEHPLDRKKAMGGCPWTLDRHALILEPISPDKKPEDHELTSLPLVVRVSQLSLANRSTQVAQLIGNHLGWFVEVPKESDSFYTPYFRIKILVDVTKPLKRGLFYQGVEGSKLWLPIAYERLPTFCFLCGIIGHGEVNCPKRYEEGFVEPEGGLPYGQWLRVLPDSKEANISTVSYPRPDDRLSTNRVARTGANIFEFGAKERESAAGKENENPNAGWGISRTGGGALSFSSSSSLVKVGESSGPEGRKQVKINKGKRKAKDGVLMELEKVSKKPQLQLRDEDLSLTAEAARQPRRTP